MSEAVQTPECEPLVLDSSWRIAGGNRGGATIHPFRVVPGEGRRAGSEAEELRELVREVIREELRSDLGRRMTGSIRRLVRDEVGRIFARLSRH